MPRHPVTPIDPHTMHIIHDLPHLDAILDGWRGPLAGDYTAYRNHCSRVLTFCLALSGDSAERREKVAIAAAFHDLGIWSHGTLDYLAPSEALASDYLAATGRDHWRAEIVAMIANHHKLTPCRAAPGSLVEPFRRADWIDLLHGWLTLGLPAPFVAETLAAFPNAGFHRRLAALTLRHLRRHPLNPLPMMRR